MATKNVPRWYPPGKYEYQGKNVLKITYGTKLQRGATNHFGTVHYTDGTAEDTDILTAKKAAVCIALIDVCAIYECNQSKPVIHARTHALMRRRHLDSLFTSAMGFPSSQSLQSITRRSQ